MVGEPGNGHAQIADHTPAGDWRLLQGQSIEIYERGKLIDRGRTEAVTNDGRILWLAQDGTHPRRLVEKLPGTELRIVAAPELSGTFGRAETHAH
jgi:hypothetical protein